MGRRADGLARSLLGALGELVLPRGCAGCERPGVALCPGCAGALAGGGLLVAAGRGRAARARGLPPCVAAARYHGPAGSLVVAFKERGRLDLTGPLAAALGGAVAAALAVSGPPPRQRGPGPVVLLVPVPASAAARRRRGFDHVARLAGAAAADARRAGRPVWLAPLLRQVRRTADQADLGSDERASNVAGAFAASPARAARLAAATGAGGAGVAVVVVDDVVTTGATVAEAARALRAAGVPVTAAAAVAAVATAGPAVCGPARPRVQLPATRVTEGGN
ncbi:MAG: ComF family protein [Frankia sp.]|nr:ComF family protein [Frankia sp.]